ncbi:MAG TPA: hypothetical protein VFP61_15340 [Acidimicrobiales bacterium]|nr:hypothetical protein [Acidimicrobiales bacterium]
MIWVWMWVTGSLAGMWALQGVAKAIARHGDARIGEEAEAWLRRQTPPHPGAQA